MTPDEIKALPAGPEIRALVAQRVMGWPNILRNDMFREYAQYGGVIVDGQPMKFLFKPRSLGASSLVAGTIPKDWKPDEDMNAAFDVMRKLRIMVRPSLIGDNWIASKFQRVYLSEKWEGACETEADMLPLAVCRAALLILEKLE